MLLSGFLDSANVHGDDDDDDDDDDDAFVTDLVQFVLWYTAEWGRVGLLEATV